MVWYEGYLLYIYLYKQCFRLHQFRDVIRRAQNMAAQLRVPHYFKPHTHTHTHTHTHSSLPPPAVKTKQNKNNQRSQEG